MDVRSTPVQIATARVCRVQALAAAALSGCGLALVMPCAVSIIADLYEERVRGRAFGAVLIFGSLGARRACEAVSCSAT